MIFLDTCALLFWCDGRELPPVITDAMRFQPCVVSCLSAWEIGIKHRLGKLPLGSPPAQWWPAVCQALALEETSFTSEQALAAAALPTIHNDPFDRGLIASAIQLGLPMATVDPVMQQYAKETRLQLV
jgi:PIN domain nuclease of toxin-antitoxin system